MYPECKLIGALLGLALIFLFSCQNKKFNQSKKMDQLFYTEEGQAYKVKVVNKYTSPVTFGGSVNGYLSVNINRDPLSGNNQYFGIDFNTTRKIFPVMASLSFVQAIVDTEIVAMSTPYFIPAIGNATSTVQAYNHMAGMSKIHPFVTRNFFTSQQIFSYAVRYDAVQLASSDFLDTQTGLLMQFNTNYWAAIAFDQAGNEIVTVPAGVYSVGVTFIYLELQ